jgi:hypothetical protein
MRRRSGPADRESPFLGCPKPSHPSESRNLPRHAESGEERGGAAESGKERLNPGRALRPGSPVPSSPWGGAGSGRPARPRIIIINIIIIIIISGAYLQLGMRLRTARKAEAALRIEYNIYNILYT